MGATDDALSEKAIYTAVDKGVNFLIRLISMAWAIPKNRWAVRLVQTKTVIATRWAMCRATTSLRLIIPKAYHRSPRAESLRRLRRDTIDFYQLHSARMSS